MKTWHIYTVEFYSDVEKNEVMKFAGKWMELVNITPSEVTQAQKMPHMFSHIDPSFKLGGLCVCNWEHLYKPGS